MLRFVDLTEAYWVDPEDGGPCCAFLDTVTDSFVTFDLGGHVFSEMRDLHGIEDDGIRERCIALLPDGFFGGLARVPAPPIVRVVDEPAVGQGEVALSYHMVTRLFPAVAPVDKTIGRRRIVLELEASSLDECMGIVPTPTEPVDDKP